MRIIRSERNPIIRPKDVKPSREDFIVECVFNAGVTFYKDEIILLLRVAERPVQNTEGVLKIPFVEENDGKMTMGIKVFDKEDVRYDFSDSRLIKGKEKTYLTSISHLRIARSRNGFDFIVDDKPFIYPEESYESFGIEDPRITKIENEYYINYSAVSQNGISTALIRTSDFVEYERLGIIFAVENRDVCIFPQKINGKYYALHRPVPNMIGKPEIWLASSYDMIHWGEHKFLMGLKSGGWESGRIGGGTVPILTDKGWLEIYHATDMKNRYCLGVLLLDINDPGKIIARGEFPILEPEAQYEIEGFFGNVVFSCGALLLDDVLRIYYGAADEVMAVAEINIQEIYDILNI